jgi:nicotinate-nucleotide pyrophosphorylase
MVDSGGVIARGGIATEVVGQRDASIRGVAVLRNHLARHCGIATFTTHLAAALADAARLVDSFVLAVNDPGQRRTPRS